MNPFNTDPRVWCDTAQQQPVKQWEKWVEPVIAALFATAYLVWMVSVALTEASWN